MRSRILCTAALAVLVSSCIITVGDEPWEGTDASISFDWTVNGNAASSSVCSDAQATRVRMSVSTNSTERHWYPEFEWSCSTGSASTSQTFAVGSYYFAWQLLDATGSVLDEVSGQHTLGIGANPLGTQAFETTIEPNEATVGFSWLINSMEPDDCECANSGGATVRLSISETSGSTDWLLATWDCTTGSAAPTDVFDPGTYYFVAELLDEGGSSLSITDEWEQTLTEGSNDLGTTDFETATTDDAYFTWEWTIEGHPYATTDYDALCAWAGYGASTIRLIIDVDHDTYEDFYYDADCAPGGAVTDHTDDPACYQAGDEVWFAFELYATSDLTTPLAQSAEYVVLTVAAGENDLGSVDFDFGDYGPLDVTVNWATNTGSTTFGGCTAPPEDVYIMGYLLRYSDGSVADEVDIDTDPMSCTTDLSWLETDFDTYQLVLDGEDYMDTYRWGSTCTDLVVDDETENAWSCDVIMTMYP